MTKLVTDGAEVAAYTAFVKDRLSEANELLRAMVVAKHAPVELAAAVAGVGEVLAAPLMAAHLRSKGCRALAVDSREVIMIEDGGDPVPTVVWDESQAAMDRYISTLPADPSKCPEVLVFPGFVASDRKGAPATLSRNGSDFSASIVGSLLRASVIVIWTDVDGVYTADPRVVTDAQRVDVMSYREAMELSNFGAKVLHPQTMAPAVRDGIPIVVKSTFTPESGGTVIREREPDAPAPLSVSDCVKGIATINRVALINMEGAGMVGIPGVSERLFGCLRRVGVSVIFIAQASSEYSICFAVKGDEAEVSREAIEKEFFRELHLKITGLEVRADCAVLAVVGDGMSRTPGVAGTVCKALGSAGVNIRAIAQGSGERNISIVIEGGDEAKALRAVHRACIGAATRKPSVDASAADDDAPAPRRAPYSTRAAVVAVIGSGLVGGALLEQLRATSRAIYIGAVCNSTKMSIATLPEGADPAHVAPEMVSRPLNLQSMVEAVEALAERLHATPIVVDCTSSQAIADSYPAWLRRGVSVVTPNKKAFSGPAQAWREVRRAAAEGHAACKHEATVGAGLPILTTLEDLVDTGDSIKRVEGIFSGTLSFLFNTFCPATAAGSAEPFSAVVAKAKQAGYTEPDPRDDLNGTDMARKVVILARLCGLDVELSSMKVASLVPEPLRACSAEEYMRRLPEFDAEMEKLKAEAQAKGQVIRFVGVVDVAKKEVSVSLGTYPATHPFAALQGSDNVIAFTTQRYTRPLVIQGAGAGAQVTAHGIFRDIIELTRRA